MNDFCLPEVFDKHRVPDHLLAEGYERTSPEHRAWLKTTLALAQSVYGESPTALSQQRVNTQTGFGHALQTGPAPWALLVLDASFKAAPRLAAALMVARLANVDNVVVVRLVESFPQKTSDFPLALIAALELTGVDHVLTLTLDATTTLCSALHHAHGHGRLLLFGVKPPSPLSTTFDQLSQATNLPLWVDHPPQLGISPHADVDEKLLCWAHPDATLTVLETQKGAGLMPTLVSPLPQTLASPAPPPTSSSSPMASPLHFDALLCATLDENLPATAPLRLLCDPATNLAGAWLIPSLGPAFFQDSVLTAFMVQNSD